jgi:hypothetical protein
MKNSTKVRLHLSKQLFESLTREIIKEAKANDGYTVAVKQPKTPKQSKSQAASPEVQKTDAETKMEAAPMAAKQGGTSTTGTLAKDLRQKAQDVTKTSGISSREVAGLQKLLNTILAKAPGGELAVAIDKAQRALDVSSQNIKAGEKSAPDSTVPTNPKTMNAIPGLKEMEMNVAEEGQMNEIDLGATDWAAIAAGMAAIGLAPLAIEKMHKWWEKKHPESFKKAQGVSGALSKQAGGNAPGDKEGQVQTGKFENTLKEYEHHYEVRNGECRRYNDEGEYTVVSMHHCR